MSMLQNPETKAPHGTPINIPLHLAHLPHEKDTPLAAPKGKRQRASNHRDLHASNTHPSIFLAVWSRTSDFPF
jgi:hypothetical protein